MTEDDELTAPCRRRQGLAIMAAGTLLLICAWRLLPPASPPLFDGLCIVSPYQPLAPPPGGAAQPATGASKSLNVSDGQPGTELITGESPPQASLEMGEGTLAIPPGASSVKLSITPVPPPATPPDDGHIDGNVYRFEATTAGRPVSLAPGHNAEILLRPTNPNGSGSDRAVEQLVGGRWRRLDTTPMTCADTLAVVSGSLGDFAVVAHGDAGSSPDQGGGSVPLGPVVVAAVVLLLLGTLAAIRLRRARRGG